jgi:lysozyme
MTPRHHVSRAAIELIKRFEGYRRTAARLPDGRWTIGYGHTLSAREGAEVSEADAEALLVYDLMAIAEGVAELVYSPLSVAQFDGLCAFAFSVGLEAFRGSEVLKRVNEGAYIQAAFAMELWRRAEFAGESLVIDAMVRRRAAEKLLFLTPDDGAWRAVPSALLAPQLDREARDNAPLAEPDAVYAWLDGEDALVTREMAPEADALDGLGPAVAAAEAAGARPAMLFADDQFLPELLALEPPPQAEGELGDVEGEAAEPAPETFVPAESGDADFFEAEFIEAARVSTRPVQKPPVAEEPVEAEFVEAEAATAEPVQAAPAPEEPAPEEPAPEEPGRQEPVQGEPELEARRPDAPTPEAAAATAVDPAHDEPMPRILIDDTAPYEFVAPTVQPLEPRVDNGPMVVTVLLVLGLAFFSGGLFWAFNATPGPQGEVFTPLLVGWLAGFTGVAFVAVAVFMLLQRLGAATERRER